MPSSEPIVLRKPPRATSPRRRATTAVIAVVFMTALGLMLMDTVIRLLSQVP
jgi:hypothetical protein